LGLNRQFSSNHQIALSVDGTLSGVLGKANERVDMSSMMVFVTKDGKEIKRAKVARDGRFAVTGMTPGCYGLVAVGSQGVAATGFCAVTPGVAAVKRGGEYLVSAMANASSLNIELGQSVSSKNGPEEVIADNQELAAAPTAAPGMGAGFGGAPMTGGGGGGGIGASSGGLGIGGLASIGGLIAAATIIATDNNNDASVVSPIVPPR
jgi:hypothetical protein